MLFYLLIIDLLFSRLETDPRRKRKLNKKVCSCCEGILRSREFDWTLFIERVNREEKNHADWMNEHILEINREVKMKNCQFPVY